MESRDKGMDSQVSDVIEIKDQRDLLVLNQIRSWEACSSPSNLGQCKEKYQENKIL